MSQAPSPDAYQRPVFDPDVPVDPECPLCWDNGKLAGGHVFAEGELFFVYVFLTEDGKLKDCFIAPKQHHPDPEFLPPTWGAEFWRFFAQLRDAYGIKEHNGYWNEGYAAGQRIMGHWHVRIDPAPKGGSHAYGKGLALLRRDHDDMIYRLYAEISQLQTQCAELQEKYNRAIAWS